ncbi:MAG: arginine--tRNA ligase [Candidatus Heimdallarchaeota archaeon]
MTQNPETIIIEDIQGGLAKVFKELDLTGKPTIQETAKKSTFGDYCTPTFQIAGANKRNPQELAKIITEKFPKLDCVEKVSAEGGFVNYKLNRAHCSRLILSKILANEKFYQSDLYKGKRIIVEHTSANPNGPIHIGNFRGSIIGDTYARILKAAGAEVLTNFYVDDLGHQIPVLVIGYELLKKYDTVPTDIKIDHLLGRIYAITHTMYDIQKIKKELKEKYNLTLGKDINWITKEEVKQLEVSFKEKNISIEDQKTQLKQSEFILNIQTDIYKRFKKFYKILKTCLEKEGINLTIAVPDLNRRYMSNEKDAVKKVRATCEDALRGQREELAILGIEHDNYDWEADLQWSGQVDAALTNLNKNGFLIEDGKARLFDANKAADLEGARKYLKMKSSYEIPKPILVTSTGDTLYLLRDIAYSLKKVDHYSADKVFNVIGKGQELSQRQLNLAVRAVGREDAANKMWHLNYEFMELQGALTSMSARRLQYITPLELYEKTHEAVMENFLQKRDYPQKEKDDIARIVTVGAIKYSIIAIGLMRKLLFNPQEVVSLSNNTSPFIQYAYARSQNILAKTDFVWNKKKESSLESLFEKEEWAIVLSLAKLPNIVLNAAEQIKPELICNYLFELANLFNKFYEVHRVLDADTEEITTARLALTYATGKQLTEGLNLLGIESPSRM